MNRKNGGLIKVLVALILGLFGIWAAFQELLITWPLVVIYLMLVWKEYALYTPFVAKGVSFHFLLQKIFTTTLEIIFYILLSLSFAHPARFALIILGFLLFELASHIGSNPKGSVSRRIKMNVTEALLALLSFLALFSIHTQVILILWGILATEITIYFTLFRKLYVVS